MQRETAMDNFAKAERIEFLLEQQGRLWNCLNWHCAGQDMKIAKLIFSSFNLFYRGTKMPMGICPWIGIEQVEKTVPHKLHFILVSGNIGKKTSA